MDKIRIQNLEVFGKHGVFKEENILGQKFLLNATLHTDMRKSGKTDELADSIDYGNVCHFMTEFVSNHTFKLLEAVAEHLAESMLLNIKHLKSVELEIKKPWAPIGLPIETVSVEISRGWHEVYLSIGSNMGNKESYLKQGIQELKKIQEIRHVRMSSVLKTAPYGREDQDEFLNACVELETILSPEELLEELHRVESDAGRERIVHWGPRTLDMDILFYDDLILYSETLNIPHIDMHNRQFVLQPLAELCPGKVHPVLHRTVKHLLDELYQRESLGGK